MMNHCKFICPVCGADMVKRTGPRVTFYGCENYPITGCIGKRSLEGNEWGDYSNYVSSFVGTLVREGFTYTEAIECENEWNRLEEKDHWE